MNISKMIIGVFGGLGLFLFGMKMMGDGLENAAGQKLKSILEKVTSNKFMAVIVGTVVTSIIQSSSATTVMVVGFVNAGIMNLFQATGVIMGANIGTTVTAQLIAFKLTDIAPVFIGIGALIVMFAKVKKNRELGSIILGFGILFMGMGAMSSAMSPLKDSVEFMNFIASMQSNWLLSLLCGLVVTGIIQSSSATTGIIIALASTGVVNLSVAIPFIFGCNIGTCVTALLSSIGTNRSAHKAAIIHLSFNIIGVIIFIPFRLILADFVMHLCAGEFGNLFSPISAANLSAYLDPSTVSRQIAFAHTIFNICTTLILFPFINVLVNWVNKLLPEDPNEKVHGTKFIDERLLQTPVIAVGQTVNETVRMANIALENVKLSMEAFNKKSEKLIEEVYKNEALINYLEQEITNYLVKLYALDLSDEELRIISSTFHIVKDIERIGDHAENIADLAGEEMLKGIKFSNDAASEIKEMYDNTIKALEASIESYQNNNTLKAEEALKFEEKIDSLEKEFRESHVKRLSSGFCSASAGTIFIDILSNYERVGDHATNIAQRVLYK